MNRRNFIRNLLVGGVSFAILPGAGRLWKATRTFESKWIENPDWVSAPFRIHFWTAVPLTNDLSHYAGTFHPMYTDRLRTPKFLALLV